MDLKLENIILNKDLNIILIDLSKIKSITRK
jgi:hypothetical protein